MKNAIVLSNFKLLNTLEIIILWKTENLISKIVPEFLQSNRNNSFTLKAYDNNRIIKLNEYDIALITYYGMLFIICSMDINDFSVVFCFSRVLFF